MLNWDQLAPAETARRLACDCSATPMVTAADGEPLSVGRARRTIPAPLRRAIVHRDRHCRFPGCDRHASWADGHNLRHWVDGGRPPSGTSGCSAGGTTAWCTRAAGAWSGNRTAPA